MLSKEPVRRRKLFEEIVVRLEQAILDGRIKPGDQLPSERELMELYGVGRTSVREALFTLQRMGLVSINSGERARAMEPTAEALVSELSGAARHLLAQPGGVRHFQEARMFFEVGLVREAARHATDRDLAALAAALEENRKAIGHPNTFERTDVAFHFVLAQMTRNPIFVALHAAIADWLMEQRTTSLRIKGAGRTAYEAHSRIYDAIASRDPDQAETAMREHLEEVNRRYWAVIELRIDEA